MGKKVCKNLFETDLRKERSPYMEGGDLRWTVDMNNGSKFGAEKMLPVGFPMQLLDEPAAPAVPKMNRVDSYKTPPMKMTLETIEEDKPEYEKPDYLLRSKSLPTRRRTPMERNGLRQSRFLTYRSGQEGGHLAEGGYPEEDQGHSVGDSTCFAADGTYFAGDGDFRAGGGGYGVSISGPIIGTPSEYKDVAIFFDSACMCGNLQKCEAQSSTSNFLKRLSRAEIALETNIGYSTNQLHGMTPRFYLTHVAPLLVLNEHVGTMVHNQCVTPRICTACNACYY